MWRTISALGISTKQTAHCWAGPSFGIVAVETGTDFNDWPVNELAISDTLPFMVIASFSKRSKSLCLFKLVPKNRKIKEFSKKGNFGLVRIFGKTFSKKGNLDLCEKILTFHRVKNRENFRSCDAACHLVFLLFLKIF